MEQNNFNPYVNGTDGKASQGGAYYNPPQYEYAYNGGYQYNSFIQKQYEQAQMIKDQKSQLRKISFGLGCAVIAYIVIQLVASMVLLRVDYGSGTLYDLYQDNAIFSYAFNILFISILAVAVPFGFVALINRKKYRHSIIPSKKTDFSNTLIWICFGMGCCVVANIVTNLFISFLETKFGITLTQGETAAPDSLAACILDIIGIAVVPAVCEEFAMRCCSLQLLRNYGKGFAVVAVSVVFGLLHGNVIQFVFAFLVGLTLAYITIKTDSIAPAIFVHMLNNGMSAFSDTLKYITGNSELNITGVMFAFWFSVGLISFIYLAVKKQLKIEKEENDCLLGTGQKISSFLFPGMIIPFLILIFMTAQTVHRG